MYSDINNNDLIAIIENIDQMECIRERTGQWDEWSEKILTTQKHFVWFMARIDRVLSSEDFETYENVVNDEMGDMLNHPPLSLKEYDSYYSAVVDLEISLEQINHFHNAIISNQYEIVRTVIMDGYIDKDWLVTLADEIGTMMGSTDVLFKKFIAAQNFLINSENSKGNS